MIDIEESERRGFELGILRAAKIAKSWKADDAVVNAILIEWMGVSRGLIEAKSAMEKG